MESGLPVCNREIIAGSLCSLSASWFASLTLLLAALFLPAKPAWAGQSESPRPVPAPPEAFRPQAHAQASLLEPGPCRLRKAGAEMMIKAVDSAAAAAGVSVNHRLGEQPPPCLPLLPVINWYQRFTNGPQVKPMTPREKGWLALRNVTDPFNAITILGTPALRWATTPTPPTAPE